MRQRPWPAASLALASFAVSASPVLAFAPSAVADCASGSSTSTAAAIALRAAPLGAAQSVPRRGRQTILQPAGSRPHLVGVAEGGLQVSRRERCERRYHCVGLARIERGAGLLEGAGDGCLPSFLLLLDRGLGGERRACLVGKDPGVTVRKHDELGGGQLSAAAA